MGEQPAAGGMISRGWAKVSYRQSLWIPCPRTFIDGHDRTAWAAMFAEAWWDASGVKHGKRQVAALARQLSLIHESMWGGRFALDVAFIHLPHPRLTPLAVALAYGPASGERESELRVLAHADDPAAVKPPTVEEFRTDALGPGLKVTRYLPGEGGSIVCGLEYAFRHDELETALRLYTASSDLGRVQRALPDIDDLANAITVLPRTRFPPQ